MNKKQIVSGILATSLLFGGYSAADAKVISNNKEKNNDNKIENKVFIKGGDLDKSEVEDTKDELDVNSSYKTYSINKDEVTELTGSSYAFIHSSASIVPNKIKKGVTVEITTPDNITRITEEQYANAAITAGIKNAHIKIASIDRVTGEGALAGIHKSYAEEGNELNQQDIDNANDEMETLAQINDENKDKDDYSDEAMNNAVADMKEQVANEKAKGNDVSSKDVDKIVDKTLKDKGIRDSLNDNQITNINNIVINASKSSAMEQDPEAYADQASKLKDNLSGSIDKLKEKAYDNKGLLAKIWDAIVGFFEAIVNFFKNLF